MQLMSSEETMDTEDELDGESTDGPWTLSAQRGILRCNSTRQRLESAIFNAVSLGQWEVAQAFFTALAHEDATGRENARELLKLLIMETSNFCSVSASIPTPHHLSWLALQAYHSIFPDPKDQLPDYVGKLIEFRLLLCSLQDSSTTTSVSTTSTLCRYHATHVLAIPGAVPESVSPFPSTILSFLHDVLVSKPATGHALIRSLTVPDSPTHLVNNEALQLLYVEAINESLEAILQLKLPEAAETDSDSQYESDHTWTTASQGRQNVTKECRRLTNLVYDLLSLMDPQPDMSRVSVDKLFVFLLELCHQLGPERLIRFDSSQIHSCLLGRSSPYLLKRLHDAEEYIRNKQANGSSPTNKKNSVSSARSLQLLRQTGTTGDWRGVFYHAHHDRKHFLECVLDTGLKLIRVGQLNEVSQLLSQPEYAPLRPVLLLLGWDIFIAEGSGKELTEALWPSQVSLSQPLLYEGCCRLAFQVELVQWCLDKARPHLLPSSSPHPPHTYRGEMFKGLETHSVLYILHHHTPLASLDPLEVVEILKHRPRVPSLSLAITPPPQFSRGPTPQKPLRESDMSPGPSVLTTPQRHQVGHLKPEQERDITVFRSFRALKLVLDALWAAVQISSGMIPSFLDRDENRENDSGKGGQKQDTGRDKDTHTEIKPHFSAARKLEFGQGVTDEDNKETVNVNREGDLLDPAPSLQNQAYSKLVLDKLKEAKTYISLLYPLNYRLEILENVFSLLFLTNEDIHALHQQEESKLSSAKLPHGPNSSHVEGSSKLPHSDSEYSSSYSSMALIRSKHGFLINEKVASDLLGILQDSMFEMRAARFVLTQSTNTGTATTLQTDSIRSSISSSSVQQRSAKLEQYINEARWRLQLISSKHGIVASRNQSDSFKGKWVEFSSSGDSGSEVSETDSEPEEKQERERKRKPSQKTSTEPEVKPSDIQTTPEIDPASVLVSAQPPSIKTKSAYSGKMSPSANSGNSKSSQYAASLTTPVMKSPRTSPSPKLGTRSRLQQRESEGRNEAQSPLVSASSHRSSDHPLCDVDSGDFADVEEKSPQHKKRKKRLRSRSLQAAKKRRMKVSERMDAGSAHGSVISQMLASPSSLLRMCLKHSNYLRASEVLKMFKMEGQFGEAFVLFSEKFESVTQELTDHSRTSTPKHSPSLTPQDLLSQQQAKSSTVTTSLNQPGLSQRPSPIHPNAHLHVAIANATSSTSALESLHHLLAPSSLQHMLLSGDDQLQRAAQDSATLQVLIEHVPSLVMLDIACSTRMDGHLAKRIIEEATNRCQPILEPFTVSHSGSRRISPNKKLSLHYDVNLPGPFSLLVLLSEVSGYFASSGLPSVSLDRSLPRSYHSPHSLLSSFSRQLRTTSVTSYKSFLASYRSVRDRLSKLLECDAVVKDDIVITLMQSSLSLDEPQHSLSQSLQHNRLNSLFEELVHVLAVNQRAPVVPGSPKDRGLMRRSSSVALSPGQSSSEEGGVNINFVHWFSRYLNQLMELLLKCLSPTHATFSEASLLVSILQESPTRLLGRLVFEVGVTPQRLEYLMASFNHIHVMEVLVKCCCPPLPAHTSSVAHSALPESKAVVPLNDGERTGSVSDLCTFSQKLLTKLLSLLKENLGHDGTVTTEELLAIYKSPQMKKLIFKIRLLSSVDLHTLRTTAEQISFYSNIVNFLYVHCVMACIAGEHGESEAAGTLQQSMVSVTDLQRSPVLQAGVFSHLGYHIGQLGLISCHDLHYSILRRGLSGPRIAESTPLHCRLAPTKPDPWGQFSPTSPDHRILFVVHPGPASSPLPVPLLPEDLTSSLKTAERHYLSSRIQIDVAAKEVTVPQWLFNHRDDFGKPIWNERYSNSSFHYLPDFCLLSYLQAHVDREQSELLQPLVVACETAMTRKHSPPIKVLVKKDTLRFGYDFTSESQHHPTSPQSPQTSPKTLRRRLSKLRGSQTDIYDISREVEPQTQTAKGFSFTSDTLSFVTHQNPLLAALIHLLCPPPPAPSSTALTISSRKTNKTGYEEDSTTGVGITSDTSEGDRDEREKEDSGWKASLFSLRGRSRTLSRRISSSYDHLTTLTPPTVSLWQRELDDILVQFVQFEPMQQFLKARLASFNSILTWDPPDVRTGIGTTHDQKGSTFSLLEPRNTLRYLALLPSRGHEFGVACSYTFHQLLESGRAQDAVRFLFSEPAACNRRRLHLLSDLAVSLAFVERYSEVLSLGQGGEMARDTLDTVSPLTLLFQLTDTEMAARLALSSLHNWPVNVCRDILSLCSHRLPPTSPLLPTVQGKLKKITVYVRIMDKCRGVLFTRMRTKRKEEPKSWKCWSDLASDSENRPQYVLGVLIAEKAFDIARTWAVVHDLGQDIMQQIEVDYLSGLLEGSSPDPMSAHRVLDSLVEDKLRLQVCESVLNQHTRDMASGCVSNLETVIFILHYILSKLDKSVKEEKRTKYINWLLGAKALLCLPREERSDYNSLIVDAALLVEQLLINKKTELAAVVIKELRQNRHIEALSICDMPKVAEGTPMVMSHLKGETDNDPFTPLIAFYANKTLEFPEPVHRSTTPQSFSASITPQSTYPTSPDHPSLLSPNERYSSTLPSSRMSYTHRRKRSSQTPISPTPMVQSDRYQPPTRPPPKEQWVPDAKATQCPVCHDVYFGMFNRRHHCRRCGRVVCARCSSCVSQVHGYGDRPQRVCKECYSFEQSKQSAYLEDGGYSSNYQSYLSKAFPALSSSPLLQWRLLPNDDPYNHNIRKEFYYEDSPSSALCLTLVDLIGSQHLAASYLLDCCHTVSLQLVPDTHGRINPEVDHYFVIGLIQNLLWSAKLRFEEATDSSGVELCDTYLSRVDLLRQLVSSRSTVIPSIQELTKPELARRVRDRLIQEDRFDLAMEVSTKCQLDTSTVWSAWGMACLRCGELPKARGKFKNCFQMSSQRGHGVTSGRRGSSVSVANTQLLERIVDQLEQNPLSIITRNTQHFDDWSSVVVSSFEKHSEDCDLDAHRFRECLYYIQTYGSPATAVAFFMRHNCWTNACKYILDEKCTVEVFVEQLWVPALKAGVIENVQDILKALDHSLIQWESYLTAVCRYLSQRSLYHILYQTQLYMRDFIRAGMTCIKFFIGFAGRRTTIRDLYSRLHYLNTAQRHFQSALDAKQRVRGRPTGGRGRGYHHRSDDFMASIKNMSVTDLEGHISTIALQMKVTEFMYRCAEMAGTLRAPMSTSVEGGGASSSGSGARRPPQPITLFSSGHTRAEVAVQLMLSSQDILEGFKLAQEIVTTYCLPPSNVLCEVSRGLAAAHRYSDVRVLLDCLKKSSFASESLNDEVLMAAIKVLASQTRETKQIEKLVQLLTSERSKIKALVQCGKLKNAYLIAIKSRHVQEVRNISKIAEKAGQLAVRDICEKWLETNTGSRK